MVIDAKSGFGLDEDDAKGDQGASAKDANKSSGLKRIAKQVIDII